MVDIANVAQREHWTTVAGPKWIGLGEVMETRMREVNDLLLREARAEPGERILDVGCGTGTTTLPLAETVGERGQVLGVDISEPMLSIARRRVAERRVPNVSLLLADAQAHRFEPERFDLIASRFGVMFFENPIAAFRNLRDALRPGGRLCFVCWAPLDENPHWRLPLDIVVRHVGAPAPKPPHAPGPLAFSDARHVRTILDAAGFTSLAIAPVPVRIVGSTPEQEADFACLMGPPGSLLDERSPDAAVRSTIKQEMTRAFAAFTTADGIRLPASVFVVDARRP